MNSHSIDWRSVLGDELYDQLEAEQGELQQAAMEPAPRAVRLNRGVCDADLPFATDQVPWWPSGRYPRSSDIRPGQYLQHAAGDYYVQDAASMLALALCQVQPGQTVCDACASPGGKSTGLLEQLGGSGVMVSNDVIHSRVPPLILALARSRHSNYLLMNHELERLAKLCGSSFDCVLVDAPCSGQSMVAQSKQSMSAFSASQISHSSARQRRIIRAAADLVRPGGRLVYSTCTYSVAENEQIISDFLADAAAWEPIQIQQLATWECSQAPGCYRLWPHRDRCAGAFAAAIRKGVDGEFRQPVASSKRHRRWQPVRESLDRQMWWHQAETSRLLQFKDEIHRFPIAAEPSWIDASISGSPLARSKLASNSSSSRARVKSNWQPLYAAATAVKLPVLSGRSTELDDRQAIQYVGGESIRGGFEGHGWTLVTWRDRVLSWGKLVRGELKNHFPKGLRQRVLM